MKKFNLFILFSAVFFCSAVSAGKLPVIILPDQPTRFEKTAAAELATHLKMVCGKDIRVINESRAPRDGRRILLGATKRAASVGVDFAKYTPEKWLIRALDTDTLILGGGSPRGVIYSVYEYLERNHGVIWLDENDTFVKKSDSIQWKKSWNISGQPSIAYRSVYNIFQPQSWLWKIRHRQNFFHVQEKRFEDYGVASLFGAPKSWHNFYLYTADVKKEDEDIFSLVKGKRLRATTGHGPGQICYSNPKTLALFKKKLTEYIAKDRKGVQAEFYPVYYSISGNDNRQECECTGCTAIIKKYKSKAAAKLIFVNKLAKLFPHITLLTPAYGEHAFPPEKLKMEKNVVIDMALGPRIPDRYRDNFRPFTHPANKITRELLEKWSKLHGKTIWDYCTEQHLPYWPSSNIDACTENIRFYKSLGVKMIMAEFPKPATLSFWRMRNHIYYKVMNDCSVDTSAAKENFAKAYYGNAWKPMLELHDYIQKRNSEITDSLCDLPIALRKDLDKEFFINAERLLSAAEKAVGNDKRLRRRIAAERVPVDRAYIEKFHISDPAFIARYRKNALDNINEMLHPYAKKRLLPHIELFCKTAVAKIPPLKGFDTKSIVADYAWPQLINWRYNKLVADPDADGGQAITHTGKFNFQRGIEFSVYDLASRKYNLKNKHINLKDAPHDEKYHWYIIGPLTITKESVLILHHSWRAQYTLSGAFANPEIYGNNVYIAISLKVQGPSYIKGSEKPDLYTVDRVVVTRADMGKPAPGKRK